MSHGFHQHIKEHSCFSVGNWESCDLHPSVLPSLEHSISVPLTDITVILL